MCKMNTTSLQQVVFWLQQEVVIPNAEQKLTLSKSLKWMGEQSGVNML